jgi:hypothetical protein
MNDLVLLPSTLLFGCDDVSSDVFFMLHYLPTTSAHVVLHIEKPQRPYHSQFTPVLCTFCLL